MGPGTAAAAVPIWTFPVWTEFWRGSERPIPMVIAEVFWKLAQAAAASVKQRKAPDPFALSKRTSPGDCVLLKSKKSPVAVAVKIVPRICTDWLVAAPCKAVVVRPSFNARFQPVISTVDKLVP